MLNLNSNQKVTILNCLRAQAANQQKEYRQYDGHEQKYVLGIAKRQRRTGFGIVMMKDDFILVLPESQKREFVDMDNKQRCCITVWSWRNKIGTSVDLADIEYVQLPSAYMLLKTINTALRMDIDPTNALMIDGSLWLPTDYVRSITTPDEFRALECDVITWIPDFNITDAMREAHRQEKAEFELQCGGYDTSDYL